MLLLLTATLQTGVDSSIPHGLVARIRRSHRRGPGSIPGVGTVLTCLIVSVVKWSSRLLHTQKVVSSILTGNRCVFDKSDNMELQCSINHSSNGEESTLVALIKIEIE